MSSKNIYKRYKTSALHKNVVHSGLVSLASLAYDYGAVKSVAYATLNEQLRVRFKISHCYVRSRNVSHHRGYIAAAWLSGKSAEQRHIVRSAQACMHENSTYFSSFSRRNTSPNHKVTNAGADRFQNVGT